MKGENLRLISLFKYMPCYVVFCSFYHVYNNMTGYVIIEKKARSLLTGAQIYDNLFCVDFLG